MKDGIDKIDFGPILKKRVRELMIEKGWDVDDLIEKSPLSEDTLANVYYGRSHDPRASTLLGLSETFNISINCLLGKCNHTAQERLLLRNYRASGQRGRSLIELTAKYEASAVKEEREAAGAHPVPCLYPPGGIQDGIVYDACRTEDIETVVPEAYVAIQMGGNDLAPLYCKGDIVLLANRFPRSGEYAAFYIGKLVYIKQFIEEGERYILRGYRSQGADLVLRRMDEVDYIGTCVGVIRK